MKKLQIIFRDILEAKDIGNIYKLNEASLGRAYQLYLNSAEKSFGIITAYRSNKKLQINRENNEKLEHMIRSWGYGYTRLKGYGNEKDEDGNWRRVGKPEPSFWINGILLKEIERAGKKFEQDFILYSGPETNGKVMNIDLEAGDRVDLGEFHPMKIGQYYSKIKGKPFIFEYVAQSMGEHTYEMAFRREKNG